jgi:Tol biopolymer transport system component
MRASALALLAALTVAVPAIAAPSRPGRTATLTFKLVTMNGKRHVLSRHVIDPYVYSLSPDHTKFAYISQRDNGEKDAPLMVTDVRSPRERVLIDTGWAFSGVSWAPNGRQLAVIGQTNQFDGGVWLVSPDDGNIERKLTAHGVGLLWSPDSTYLAHSRPISVFSLEAEEDRFVSNGHSPQWSPDGGRIAFVHNTPFQGQVIGVASVRTGEIRDLVPGQYPTWSPDGRRIAFIRFIGDAYHIDLWVMPSRRGKPRRLARGLTPLTPFVWSPNGRQIAYVRGTTLFVRRLDGRAGRRLAYETAAVMPLAWSRDGRHLLYFTLRR